MSELALLRALLFAGECFLASALLPLPAFAAAALLRRRAALRHLVFTTLFGVLAVLPVVALLLPPRLILRPAAAPLAGPVVDAGALVAAPPTLLTAENAVLLLAALWLAGLGLQMLRLALGGLGLRRLRRASAPFAVELQTGCVVRLSDGEHGPSTFGIIRPVILLPRSAAGWPAARMEAVLRHEAAHVARRDTASRLVARLACALYWFNPLLWLAARALRRDAEIAADDAVLAGGMTPSVYAAELVGLAAESRGVSPPIPPGIAMAGAPLARRVEAVLAENSSRKGVTRMDMARTACLGLAAALLLGAARFDIAAAQDAAPPAPPARPAPRIGVPVDARPRVEVRKEVRKEVRVDVDRQVAVDVQTAIEARSAAVKAEADVAVAVARARAAAETDPAQKETLRQVAQQMAAQAAVTKADADLAAARAREAARREADGRQRGADAQANAAAAAAWRDSMRALEQIGPTIQAAVTQALADAHVSEEVARALADAHIGETIARELEKARPEIEAAMADARRRALPAPPVPPAAPSPRAPAALPAPPAPR